MHQFSTLWLCCAPKSRARRRSPFVPTSLRAFHLPVGHVPALRKLIGQIVETDRNEVREHDLGNRLQPGHGRAHGGSHDRLFRDRRIAHAQRAESIEESRLSGFEDAAGFAYILAQEDHIGVALHLLRNAAGHGVAIG